MYQFYYNIVNELWPKNEIVASDKDALIMNIFTEDIYEDMKQIQNELDTSDYPKNHNLIQKKIKRK